MRYYVGIDIVEDGQHYAVLNSPKFQTYEEADAWYRSITFLEECDSSAAIYEEDDTGIIESYTLF